MYSVYRVKVGTKNADKFDPHFIECFGHLTIITRDVQSVAQQAIDVVASLYEDDLNLNKESLYIESLTRSKNLKDSMIVVDGKRLSGS